MKKKLKGGLTNLRGLQVGDLTVLRKGPQQRTKLGRTRAQWYCRCDCGKEVLVAHNRLIDKVRPKTHCGCQNKGLPTLYKREYHAWHSMIMRCYSKKHPGFKDYGGKGVTVCDAWRDPVNGFEAFFNYVGEKPKPKSKYSLDRKDPWGNYEPGNVRWATAEEQANNQRKHWLPPEERTS